MGEEVAIRVTRRRALVDEWALVLVAEGLHPSIGGERGGFALAVPDEEVLRARALLDAWEHESRERAAEAAAVALPDPSLDPAAGRHALTLSAALVAFFLITGPDAPEVTWFARGAADAQQLVGGEPWRAVTALTLHADAAHVFGNAVAGALFLAGVFSAFGLGVGSALVLAAGAGGNLANAWIHRAGGHLSIGASTAVFGALGILAGRALVRGRARGARGKRAWIPVAAALALLAMIGTEGQHVDLWAHVLGLAVGGVLGVVAALLRWGAASRTAQRLAGAGAIALAISSWALALGR
jgi:membrane associated rhomboid family serine protease